MQEHVCSYMTTACEREKFAKRASHRFIGQTKPSLPVVKYVLLKDAKSWEMRLLLINITKNDYFKIVL